MGTLTQLQQNRRIIQDFTATSLAGLPNQFARLVYVSSLRDLATNRYEHAGLSAVYPPNAVQRALEQCHEELFERVLESPLPVQEDDLRSYLAPVPGGLRSAASNWLRMEAYRSFLPVGSPEYLKELFCSNVRTILDIVTKECSS
jgi:hypothetical protein